MANRATRDEPAEPADPVGFGAPGGMDRTFDPGGGRPRLRSWVVVGMEPVVSQLNPDACIALLGTQVIGRVAVSIGALPAIRSVRFLLVDGDIVFRVGSKSRLRQAVSDTVVAFQCDEYDAETGRGWSVVVHGVGQEVTDPGPLGLLEALPLPAWGDGADGDRFIQIPIVTVTGERVEWRADGPAGSDSSPVNA